MAVRTAKSKVVVHRLEKVVVLEKSCQNMVELLFIRQLAAYCGLCLMKLGGSHHLHRRSDLQRILHRSNPALYFLQ